MDGEFWDLSRREDISDLFKLLHRTRPLLLVGSPICGPFSPLQNLTKFKRDPKEFERVQREGRKHLHTSIDAYWTQLQSGRLFLREHPKWATSWKDPRMIELQANANVYTISGPMCRWEMIGEDATGVGYVRKETQFVTNSKILATLLEGHCEGGHRRVHLINGRAGFAQVYPPKLVKAILKAVKQELRNRNELNSVATSLDGVGPSPDGESNEIPGQLSPPTDLEEDDGELIFDSVTGVSLPHAEVWKAREEELQWVEKQQIYEVADIDEAWEVTGKAPITLKWVDRNKGDWERPNYRSRLVVREVKKEGQMLEDSELFSAMPPLEALKFLCSLMVSQKTSKHGGRLKLRILDISRAQFYGLSRRPVYTNLPPGREVPGKCAKLLKTMYGTQDASSVWQETYTKLLEEHGIVHGTAWPAIFYHKPTDSRFLCHGDDFVVLADSKGQQFVEDVLKKKFEFRVGGSIGPDACDGTSVTVLNRIMEFDRATGKIRYEADPRRAETVVRQLNLADAKPVATPAEKVSAQEALAASRFQLIELACIGRLLCAVLTSARTGLTSVRLSRAWRASWHRPRSIHGESSKDWDGISKAVHV